jgi:transmembrane sensor
MKKENYRMEDFLLDESFQRYSLQNTPEDIDYWNQWIRDNPREVNVFNDAVETLKFMVLRKNQPTHRYLSDQVFEKLQKQIHSGKNMEPNPKMRRSYYWYAASVILLAGLFFILKPAKLISPQLAAKYLEIIVPTGQRSQLVLADGTKVWLNAGTTFKYPEDFLKNKREVFVEGEAFFNVTHNKDLPFIVHLKENLSIKVLGTEFNVKSYATDKFIETTLVKGAIKLLKEDKDNHVVAEINIKPNEKATYQKDNLQLVVTKLDVPVTEKSVTASKITKENKSMNDLDIITAWKDDALVFHDETFEDIAVKMERWFGMKIVITDEGLKQERFTGKFVNKETIYQILDIFNRSEPIRYLTKNKEITIKKRQRK